MSTSEVDGAKRRFLIAATTAVSGVAAVAVATPFVMSMFPSAKARAAGAPVEVDITKLEPGMKLDVEWQGKVVWLINRTEEMLSNLPKLDDRLNDPKSEKIQQPDYAQNATRSIKPKILVAVGICTHLGCSPNMKKEIGSFADVGDNWLGGFFCPCHGSKFDMAGRVFKGVPAPLNLVIPPHKYISGDTRVLIGADDIKEA